MKKAAERIETGGRPKGEKMHKAPSNSQSNNGVENRSSQDLIKLGENMQFNEAGTAYFREELLKSSKLEKYTLIRVGGVLIGEDRPEDHAFIGETGVIFLSKKDAIEWAEVHLEEQQFEEHFRDRTKQD